MRLKKTRQILKSLADDTRLRIINLLRVGGLTVSELCHILGLKQSSISKHLTRLRLTGIVYDKRAGMSVYYRLAKFENSDYQQLVNRIINSLVRLEAFKKDILSLHKYKTERSKRDKGVRK